MLEIDDDVQAHDSEPRTGSSKLRETIQNAIEKENCNLKDLTVLAPQNDPFRVDTDARHRDGKWLADTAQDLGLGDRKIHIRGLHYMVLGRTKPDGLPYTNDDPTWLWLSNDAAKAARWLGYLPFEQIVDQRNSPPEVRVFARSRPWPYISVGIDVDIPDVDDIVPRVGVGGFTGAQPYKIVLFGEKSSLADVLGPIARQYQADLYLPTGEISDTLLHHMAHTAADDGRPMVVLTFSDCDPAGWQMPISIARKLQAFNALGYEFEFEVRRVGLTPNQVRAYGLPSSPLKETERRADGWREAMGVEQTEIDALAALRPALLRDIAHEAIAAFYDDTLDRRVNQALRLWEREAQAIVDAETNTGALHTIRERAAARLSELRDEIEAINDALRIETDVFDLPTPIVPEAEITTPSNGLPLFDSRSGFAEGSRRLIASKSYRLEDER